MTPPYPPELDSDAVQWSEPWDARGTTPLVVLLHGRGSNERDLPGIVAHLGSVDAVFASLRAPIAEGDGWSWFTSGGPGRPLAASALEATALTLAWFDSIGVTASRDTPPVSIIGFSQGGAMVTQLLRHAPERFAAFVNLAGFVIDGAGASDEADARLPGLHRPVFWGRDPGDPVIPGDAIDRTLDWLPAHSDLAMREYPGIGHSISLEQARDVGDFVREAQTRAGAHTG